MSKVCSQRESNLGPQSSAYQVLNKTTAPAPITMVFKHFSGHSHLSLKIHSVARFDNRHLSLKMHNVEFVINALIG